MQTLEKKITFSSTETKGRLDAQDNAIKKMLESKDDVELIK